MTTPTANAGTPETHGRHPGASTNECDEGSDDGDRSEDGTGRVGELRVLGDLQPVEPADSPQPRHPPGRQGTEVDERGSYRGRPTALHEGEQADADLGDGDGDEQSCQRDVLGVQAGDTGVDRPGPDRGEPGELHDADRHRHRPLARGGLRRWRR